MRGVLLAQFQYRAADSQGKVVEGTIEAAEQSAVVARLQDRGLLPIRIGPAGDAKAKTSRVAMPSLPSFGAKRVGNRQLLSMTQQLSVLVGGGLPLDRSLATLAELSDHPEMKRIVGEVLHAVQGGKGLAEALAQHPVFPPLYVNMVRAGEIGGFLEDTLKRLEEYLERGQALRDEVRAALTYPVFLVGVMSLVMVVMLTYVLPKFKDLFSGMGKTVPLQARIVMGASEFMQAWWWAFFIVIGLLVVAWRRSVSTPKGRYRWDATKLRTPMLGLAFRKMEVATLTRTLGTLLKSGVPMLQAMGIAKEVAGNQVIAQAIADAEVGVREGGGVSAPIARTGAFPQLAIQMMAVGEETGKLDEMLVRIADHYDREVRLQVNQLVRLLEPLLIVIMGLTVGFVVVSMLGAIFTVNELPL